MAQFSGDSSMPFFWQSPQSFGLPAEDESMQLYPANAMTSTGYLEPLYETYDGSGSPIYQSMSNLSPPFHVDLQPPRFNVTWRWWEDEANVILRAFTAETMQQLVQFRLYPDDNLPRSILRCRNESSVINFLNKLLPAGDTTVVDQLTHYERVEKLLSLCSSSQFATRPWNWLPAIASNDFDYQSIARTMDEESYLQFRTVSFEDWVHYSLGYATQSVEWFLLQHSKLSDYLMNHFDAFPNQAHEYIHVEKNLRLGSPFAHQALLCCLRAKGLVRSDAGFMSTHSLTQFLVQPIQQLFREEGSDLTRTLNKLAVLKIRFRRTYLQELTMDWTRPFETQAPFLEGDSPYVDEFLQFGSPSALAGTLTHSDQRAFTGLSLTSFVEQDAKFQELMTRWTALCELVDECCEAHPHLFNGIRTCAQHLYNRKNYFSATALSHGLLAANWQSLANDLSQNPAAPPSPFSQLLDPSNNYALYRQLMHNNPGLPFLLPHAREYASHGDQGLAGLFPLPDL